MEMEHLNLKLLKMKNKQGGKRKGAGRKPKPDGEVKKPVTTYHKECDLEIIGIDVARTTAHGAIERKIKKML